MSSDSEGTESVTDRVRRMQSENEKWTKEIEVMKKELDKLERTKTMDELAIKRMEAECEQEEKKLDRIKNEVRDFDDFVLKKEPEINEYVEKSINFAIEASIESEFIMKGYEEIEELRKKINLFLPTNDMFHSSAEPMVSSQEFTEQTEDGPDEEDIDRYMERCVKKQKKILEIEEEIGNDEQIMNRFVQSGGINVVKAEPLDVDETPKRKPRKARNSVSVGDNPGTSGTARKSPRAAASENKAAESDDSEIEEVLPSSVKKEIKSENLTSDDDDDDKESNADGSEAEDFDESRVKDEIKSESESGSGSEEDVAEKIIVKPRASEDDVSDEEGENSDSELINEIINY